MCQDVIADEHVSLLAFTHEFTCRLLSKKLDTSRNAFFDGCFSNISRRLHTQDRSALCQKVLQQVSIVAGNLYYPGTLVQCESLDHHLNVCPCMAQTRTGNR